jgi:tetratricopeptide (TPR) repeat protein
MYMEHRHLTIVALFIALITAFGCSRSMAHADSVDDPTKTLVVADPGDVKLNDALRAIGRNPDAPQPYLALAGIYINRARSTGDFGLNSKAESAVEHALKNAPSDVSARKLKASLDLTYHRFDEALALGTELQQQNPNDAFVYGVLTDANVELGNYDEAVAMAQKMVNLRPNSASYARVAHLRSLNGDHKGAVEMFKTAARTADPSDHEAQAWCLVQLGDELWKYGKFAESESVYDEALATLPNYYLAQVGKGRVRASLGDFPSAIQILTAATERIPNVEGTIQLGNIFQKMGDNERAKQQYDLAEVIEARLGVNNDQKRLALLWADQAIRLDDAVEIAERETTIRRDIFTADTLAWTLYQKGLFAEANTAIGDAMRLKTNDARMTFHAGMIDKALGNKAAAKRFLAEAVKLNPAFDLLQADVARTALADLNGPNS